MKKEQTYMSFRIAKVTIFRGSRNRASYFLSDSPLSASAQYDILNNSEPLFQLLIKEI